MLQSSLPVSVQLASEAPGLLRSLSMLRDNVLSIIPEAALHAPIVSGRLGRRWHMIMEPEAIRRVMLERLESYPKSDVTKSVLGPAIGASVFIAEGAHWRWQRRAAAPAFAHRAVTALGPVMTAAAARSCDRLAQVGPKAVDITREMTATTFDVIAEVTFSGDDMFDRTAVHRAINGYIQEATLISPLDLLGLPAWLPRPGRARAMRVIEATKKAADAAIDRRKKRGTGDPPDLLDHLLSAEDPESGRRMTTAELRDNLLTFIVAGHETTALTLAWALYLVGFDPAVQQRARAEAQSVLGDRIATAGDVPNLPFIRAVVDETLRLYPAGGMISRTALEADTLCGTQIAAGDTVMVPIYALGRHRALWDAPDAFRPERFLDRKAADRFAYLPFGEGPRVCIGASFALQEAVIILASLLARFKFEAVKGRTPDPKMIITLRPQGGVWMTLSPV